MVQCALVSSSVATFIRVDWDAIECDDYRVTGTEGYK